MKRVLRPLFLMALLASLLCVSAFAMKDETIDGTVHPTAEEQVSYSYSGTVKVSGGDNEQFTVSATGGTPGAQYVLLVLKKPGNAFAEPTEDNIIYINQTEANSNGIIKFENVFPSELSTNMEYEVHIIGTGKTYNDSKSTFIYEYVTYTLGDIDGKDGIDPTDALWALQSYVTSRELNETQRKAADVNKDQEVDPTDALWILQRYVTQRDSNWEKTQ